MRRSSSTTALPETRVHALSPCWLPAAPVGCGVPNEAGSVRFQSTMGGSPGLSAATLRLALASAGAEELRVVHEMRESGLSFSGSSESFSPQTDARPAHRRPLLAKQLSLQHEDEQRQPRQQQARQQQQQQQQQAPQKRRFRSATSNGATAVPAPAAPADNPVRAALNRAFPASPTCGASTAARAARAFSHEDLKTAGDWSLPAAAAAADKSAQPARTLLDASITDRSSSGASSGGTISASSLDPQRVAWPARRSRRDGSSSGDSLGGGSFSISASGAGDMSTSAEGGSSGRSSFDRASSQGGSSFGGGRSGSDASERCGAPAVLATLRAESLPQPHAQPSVLYPGCATGSQQRSGSASPFGSGNSQCSFDSARTSGSGQMQISSRGGSSSSGGSSLSRRDAALIDADCCGDSGCPVLLSAQPVSAMPRAASLLKAASLPCDHNYPAAAKGGAPMLRGSNDDALASLLHKEGGITADKTHKWACLSDGQAAVQLFWRLNHARQTVDFVRRQRAAFGRLDKARMTIVEALAEVDTLREYETALMGEGGAAAARGMGLAEHAFQTAEACRLAHPEAEWLQLVGLLHGLGKLLAHPTFGSEAQWAVCGESFPVGCKHSGGITASEYFCVNPDRRRRMYNTPTGMYGRNCGLGSVLMSWSGPAYLHLVLTANKGARLPAPALWLLRHAKFRTLADGDYGQLLDDFDRSMIPWLLEFQELSAFKRRQLPGRLHGEALQKHYAALLAKYLPAGPLRW